MDLYNEEKEELRVLMAEYLRLVLKMELQNEEIEQLTYCNRAMEKMTEARKKMIEELDKESNNLKKKNAELNEMIKALEENVQEKIPPLDNDIVEGMKVDEPLEKKPRDEDE